MMRRIFTCITATVLIWTLTLTAFAASGKLTMSDGEALAGQTVLLKVTLQEDMTGDAMGITVSYDKSHLEFDYEQSQWEKKSVLDSFNHNNEGVWASEKPVSLKGDLCTLAFRVKTGVDFDATKVSCTVMLMKNNKETGTFKAEGTVRRSCVHTYGVWTQKDGTSHTRSCMLCKEVQTGAHKWDEGKRMPSQQGGGQQMVFTCADCGATRAVQVSSTPGITPTVPQETEPVINTMPTTYPQPETWPEQTRPVTPPPDQIHTWPTAESVYTEPEQESLPYKDYNASPEGTAQEDTVAQMIPGTSMDAQDHDHDHEQTAEKPKWITAVAVFGAVALLGIGAVIFTGKKYR